jgi:hypothetical protein
VSAISHANLILIGILLVQLAITAYLFWPSQEATTAGEPLLAGVTADSVTALAISDDSDRSVSFVKEGDTWTLAATDGYPARAEKITETLNKLVAISGDRLVTQTPGSHGRLQVAEDSYLRKVDITTADGTHTLYFGSSTGASATHVREAGEDATYLTGEIATWELDTLATTWIDVTYHQVPKEQITHVTLENANGTFTFVRGEGAEGEWTLADATADEPVAPANINTLIDRIATLNLHTVLGKSEAPEYGLDAPLATVTVTSSEATTDTTSAEIKTTTLLVGAKDEETNTYYLKSSGSEYYVRLAAFTGDEFVNKQRSDFMLNTGVESSETPAAEATPPAAASTVTTTTVTTTEVPTSTEVTTATGEIEGQVAPTTTVEASEAQTETGELEGTE